MKKIHTSLPMVVALALVAAGCLSPSRMADRLLQAHLENKAIPVLSRKYTFADLDFAIAYEIQKQYVAGRLAHDRIAGYKAALTSRETQQKFGSAEPLAGVLLESARQDNGTVVDLTGFHVPMIEIELGFVFGRKATHKLNNVEELSRHVQGIVPVVELPTLDFTDMRKLTAADIIACNTAASQFIMGNEKPVGTADLNSLSASLLLNGEQINSGKGSDAMGNQWEAALWLANTILEHGWTIEPGHVLITGALGNMVPGKTGRYVADFQDLGSVSFDIVEPEVNLTLIHFNDCESRLINSGAGLEYAGGAARFAAVIKRIRASVESKRGPNCCITVSSGDNFMPGPEFNASLLKGPPFYDAMAIDLINADALALGNHDFDFGPDVLSQFIRSFRGNLPVFLSANLDLSLEPELQGLADAGRIASGTIITRGSHRFGLVGLTTPLLHSISSPRSVIVKRDIVPIVQNEINALEADGINKIILISHLQGIKEDIELTSELRGIDIVVAGGGAELLANDSGLLVSHVADNDTHATEQIYGPYPVMVSNPDGESIPVVTTPGEYLYVGRLEVGFDSNGKIVRTGRNSGPVRVIGGREEDSVEPDPEVERHVVAPLVEALRIMNEEVVAVSETRLNGNHDDIRSRETNLGNLVADALLWSAKQTADAYDIRRAEIAMFNGGGIRNSIPAGTIHEIDISQACPFPNFITVVEGISSSNLKSLLETTFSRVDAGGSIAGASDTGRFPQIAGFSVVYNPVRAPGDRIKELRLDNGELIVKDYKLVPGARSLYLATTDFLANGGDEWNVGESPRTGIGMTLQQALTEFLRASPMTGGLGGKVTAMAYPESETQRIVRE